LRLGVEADQVHNVGKGDTELASQATNEDYFKDVDDYVVLQSYDHHVLEEHVRAKAKDGFKLCGPPSFTRSFGETRLLYIQAMTKWDNDELEVLRRTARRMDNDPNEYPQPPQSD
jgi:hypothetical protein